MTSRRLSGSIVPCLLLGLSFAACGTRPVAPMTLGHARIEMRPAEMIQHGIWAKVGGTSLLAEHLVITVTVAGSETESLHFEVSGPTGAPIVRHRQAGVMAGPNVVVIPLLDDRHRRLPAGRYRVSVEARDPSGMIHGGDTALIVIGR